MQYKSQEAAMQAKSLDGQGKSHSHAPESGKYGAGTPRSTALANTGARAGATREVHGFENLARAKAAIGERVAAARRSVEEMSDAVVARTRQSVRAADDYVHEQPWKVIGAGAAAGVLIGWLLGRRR
jgi:ElaB/YqjD/DUF883 family membrane-anchored ribosome-binding protein